MPCCCLARSECVLAVSIYGVATSVALLSVLGLHGHDFGPGFSPFTTEILHQVCLATYTVCLMTNLLLFLGLLVPLRPLLVPWLVAHSVLVLALTAASVNYLVLYSYVDCTGDCTVLLGLSVSLVVAITTILYCIYVVQDYFDILKYEQRARRKSHSEEKQVTSL